MNKKGFTLLELIGVIIILAILTAIITPLASKTIKSSKEKTVLESADNYANSVLENLISNNTVNNTKNRGIYQVSDFVDIDVTGDKPEYGWVKIDDRGVSQYVLKYGKYYAQMANGKKSISKRNISDTTAPVASYSKKIENGHVKITIDTSDDIGSGVDYIETPQNKVSVRSVYDENNKDISTKLLFIDVESILKIYDYIKTAKNRFTNVEVNYDATNDYILENNYDLVLSIGGYYGVAKYNQINELFRKGVNIFTEGNDTTSYINIISNYVNIQHSDYSVSKKISNEITYNMKDPLFVGTDSQVKVIFKDGVETWYSDTDTDTYGVFGYYEQNGTRWLHSQMYMINLVNCWNTFLKFIERAAGRKSATYIADKNGTYNFTIYDINGNSTSLSVPVTEL